MPNTSTYDIFQLFAKVCHKWRWYKPIESYPCDYDHILHDDDDDDDDDD